mgnify:CR=1 FL=1
MPSTKSAPNNPAPRCPIRGHDHALCHNRALTPINATEPQADWWECPTQGYRWFFLRSFLAAGRFEMMSKLAKPRFGWESVDKKMDRLHKEIHG